MGLQHIAQPEAISQRGFVREFVVERVDAVFAGDVIVRLRIPHLVVETVQNPAELALMHVQRVAQAVALRRMQDLPAILRRNRRDEIGIDDAALHQIDRAVIEIVLQAILMEEVGVAVQAGGAEDVFPRHALMLQVVQREADARMRHAEVLVNLVEQHRHEARFASRDSG